MIKDTEQSEIWSKDTRSQIQRQSMRSPNTVRRSTTNSGEGKIKTHLKKKRRKEGQVFHVIKDMNKSGKTFSSESPA